MIPQRKLRILVTGATGGVGMPLVAALLAGGQQVRAVARAKDARSEQLAKLGAEVVLADLYNPDQMAAATRDTQRAFYLPPIRPYMIQSAVVFADAVREAGIEHVVTMSQWTSHRAHPAAMTRQTWLVDRLFGMLPDVGLTIFNPGMFAHNFLRMIDYAALLGIYPVLSGDGRAAPVSNKDMASTAAILLAEGPDRHAGKSYRPTGPRLLDGREMAAIVAEVVGHGVRPVPMPTWLLGKVARQQGVDPYEITSLRHYMQDMRKGTFAFEGGVTTVVEDLTGTPAESFETTSRRYAALPFARQTMANRLRAVARFSAAPFYRGTDFDAWDRAMALPPAPLASLSIDDERWRREHAAQMQNHRAPPAAPVRQLHAL